MKSVFTKKKNQPNQAIPFGHNYLDARIHLKAGQIVVIKRDSPTTIWVQLLRYFLSSDKCALVSAKPLSLSKGKLEEIAAQKQQKIKNSIAWRYQQKSESAVVEKTALNLGKDAGPIPQYHFGDKGESLVKVLLRACESLVKGPDDTQPFKVGVVLPGDYQLSSEQVITIKQVVRSNFMACLVITARHCQKLVLASNYYLEASAASKAYSHFSGVLVLRRAASLGSGECSPTEEMGVKVSHKECKIERLYQNAEEEGQAQPGCGAVQF